MSWNNRNYYSRYDRGYTTELPNYGWCGSERNVWAHYQNDGPFNMTAHVHVQANYNRTSVFSRLNTFSGHNDYNRTSVFSRLNTFSGHNVTSQQAAFEHRGFHQGDNYGSATNGFGGRMVDFAEDWDFNGQRSQEGNQLLPIEGQNWSGNYQTKQNGVRPRRNQPYGRRSRPHCYRCGETFDSFRAMFAHKDAVHQINLRCRFCYKTYGSRAGLKKHEASHSIHPCLECPETFAKSELLSAHMNESHRKEPPADKPPTLTNTTSPDTPEKNDFTSPIASSTPAGSFAEKSCKDISIQTTDDGVNSQSADSGINGQITEGEITVKKEEFSCPHCIKKFEAESLLDSHVKIHTGVDEGVYIDPDCIKTCSTDEELASHVKVQKEIDASETTDTPAPVVVYSCGMCGDSFDSEQSLSSHRKTHPEAPKKPAGAPLFCPFCSKAFFTRRDLALHLTSRHTEVHYCSECPAEYSTEAELNAHRKVHYGAGQY